MRSEDERAAGNEPADVVGFEAEAAREGSGEGVGGFHAALSEQLDDVQRQRDEYLDQLQRTRAEFVNYQKRSRAQADTDRLYAVGNLAEDLLGVIDNLERAIEAARSARGREGQLSGRDTTSGSVVDGLEMVHRQFLGVMAKHGVEPIASTIGEVFDPRQHEAVAQVADPRCPEGTIAGEILRGYRLKDRILRPAQVAVSTGQPAFS